MSSQGWRWASLALLLSAESAEGSDRLPEANQAGSLEDFCSALSDDSLVFLPVHGGTYRRPDGQRVTVNDFCIQSSEVSAELYASVVGADPSDPRWKTAQQNSGRLPVQMVTWLDAVRFAVALAEAHGQAPAYRAADEPAGGVTWVRPDAYRLPSESEWEFIALQVWRSHSKRALLRSENLSDTQDPHCQDGSAALREVNVERQALPSDLFGNVSEWVWDPAPPYLSWQFRLVKGASFANTCEDLSPDLVFGRVASGPSVQNAFTGLRLAASPR